MIEIIFKGKRIDNGEWIEGDLSVNQFVKIDREEKCTYILFLPEYGDCEEDIEFIEVMPETVSQFTGLTDKKGVRIFEGDIVKHIIESEHLEKEDWDTITDKVVMIDGCWCVEAEQYPLFAFENEVIGNKHD